MRIIERTEWGARYRDGFGNRSVAGINTYVLHHTVTHSAGPNGSFAADAASWRVVERVGQQRFKGGISYGFGITEAGRVLRGTSLGRIGAHTKGYNTRGIGIVLIGNYQGHPPTKAQQDALVWLLKHLGHSLTGGHRDFKQTACPGNKAYPLIPEFNKRFAGGAVTPPKPSVPNRPSRGSTYLQPGQTSGHVKALQKHLNKNYPLYSKLVEDGSYGPATTATVVEFQRRAHITVDGNAGPNTQAAMGLSLSGGSKAPSKPKPSKPAASSSPAGYLWPGDTGRKVKALQKVLNAWYPRLPRLAADGVYGARTEARVKYMQGKARITVDGKAGPVTLGRLGIA